MREQAGIYVEILVRGALEEVWQRTQDPALHERWDLRFTDIRYLPRPDATLPQRFSYATRIGFGLRIEGEGETVGSRDGPHDEGSSALRFWSSDPKSLILEGSGYWKYIPAGDGVRFLTWYDYKTRFGNLGRFVDTIIFRPILGWATAWSFDRLRLWIERDIDPRLALERSLVHAIARISLVLIFLYQALMPKLIFRHPDELAMLADAGVPSHLLGLAITLLGAAEIAWALVIAVFGAFSLGALAHFARDDTGDPRDRASIPLAPCSRIQPRHPEPGRDCALPHKLADCGQPAVGLAVLAQAFGPSTMTSIYQRVLGSDFDRLHPQVQRRFGFGSADGIASIGRGTMEEVWHGPAYTLPFLYVGTWRRIMFPDRLRDVPFQVENYAYVDPLGRETVTWVRTFFGPRTRRFDAYMIYSEQRGRIVDYLGTHQHLAVDIDLSVDERGGMRLRSGEQRFHEGPIAFRFPLVLSGIAEVCEWYDDKSEQFRIEVNVRNRLWGPLFGYRGSFTAEWVDAGTLAVPEHAKPVRVESRE